MSGNVSILGWSEKKVSTKTPKCILRISVLGSISKCDAHFFIALCMKWNTTASLSWSLPKMKCLPDWKVFNLKQNYEALEYWQILWNAFKVHHSQLRNIKILRAWELQLNSDKENINPLLLKVHLHLCIVILIWSMCEEEIQPNGRVG